MAANFTGALASTIDEVKDIRNHLTEFRVGSLLKYTAPLTWALACIYFGSHRSLRWKNSLETLDPRIMFNFPWIASIFIFMIYIAIKYHYLLFLIQMYFLAFNIVSLFLSLQPCIVAAFQFFDIEKAFIKWDLKIPLFSQRFSFNFVQILNGLLSTSAVCWYFFTKHWIANNIIVTLLAIQLIQMVSLNDYKSACLLLIGLFFYDIFWVFKTNVMAVVSKSPLPIKFLFPKDIFASELDFSLIGLGDVIVPGWFIALLLRYDDARKRKQNKIQLFTLAYFGYAFGLCLTMYVVYKFRRAQPALLYLVPSSILPSLIGAFISGEVEMLLNYRENQPSSVSSKKIS